MFIRQSHQGILPFLGLILLTFSESLAEIYVANKSCTAGLNTAFFACKNRVNYLRVSKSSRKTPGCFVDRWSVLVEAGEFPNWRPLGKLIRDRGNYNIRRQGRQHKSNVLYITRDKERSI